ncbi:hypothetical protein [uncultured Chitinophaga sp.]|jgi:hypothetical protein|uniref:hypothetical protein n=1 Tax=uncultured Chitinophaga sp. TaxID=339340 RepID=UPI00262EE3B8|nr:hypothetical protein [uncultured Chitinophaga sp.]
MRIGNTGVWTLILLTFSCQSAPSPQESGKVIDSLIPDTVAAIGTPRSSEDDLQAAITAQDTLFEDGSRPSDWKDAGFDDPAGFKRFLILFKEWVKSDNADSIAAYIRFPIKGYKTPEQFKNNYEKIFDKELKTIVEQQRLDRIFRNYQGAMIGNGAIWFSVTENKEYRIIAINK